MTSSQQDKSERINQIIAALKTDGSNIAQLIEQALPLCAGSLTPPELDSLKDDLNGFSIQEGIDYYTRAALDEFEGGYMPRRAMVERECAGQLAVIKADGSHGDVLHEIGRRQEFFITAPIARIQELADQGGDHVMIEMPDLSEHIGKAEGGKIVLKTERAELERIVRNARRGIAALLDYVIHPQRRQALEQASQKPRGL